ncbi:hypothetical protein B0H10DRAFT_2035979 [Mycena sp. CBHHK59/15]|nr:hypothetical protein B0H10DRAFT_2035979 [Mycena sp. CBHHK59/15]
MATRPDLWPAEPWTSSQYIIELRIETATRSIFHAFPVEVLVQILPLLSLPDLLSVLLLSRGVSGLVSPLLDETLWYNVHHGDLRWILPVARVNGEVDRANKAAMGWYSNPAKLTSVFDSRDFPFSRFISECLRTNSMRNRQRLWKIYKQYKKMWETMGFEI